MWPLKVEDQETLAVVSFQSSGSASFPRIIPSSRCFFCCDWHLSPDLNYILVDPWFWPRIMLGVVRIYLWFHFFSLFCIMETVIQNLSQLCCILSFHDQKGTKERLTPAPFFCPSVISQPLLSESTKSHKKKLHTTTHQKQKSNTSRSFILQVHILHFFPLYIFLNWWIFMQAFKSWEGFHFLNHILMHFRFMIVCTLGCIIINM